jgi:DeoR/GlpR family transcriptional regulator of sugar metabolism
LTVYNRRKALLELLRQQSDLHVPEMAITLSVSEGTVRNDLNALEAEGQLIRVHGGAVLNGQSRFLSDTKRSTRFNDNVEAKKTIGRRAVELVKDGDSILLDASSTIYYFAQTLQGRRSLRIVTNGIDVARLLAQEPTNTVILLGGVINLEGTSITGLFNEQIIEELHIQKAFVSCSGFTIEHGMTEVHLAEAQIKRKAIESANQVIALIDSSKFGKEDLTSFARPEQISCLYTDIGISPEWNTRLHEAGIPFTLCGEREPSTPSS